MSWGCFFHIQNMNYYQYKIYFFSKHQKDTLTRWLHATFKLLFDYKPNYGLKVFDIELEFEKNGNTPVKVVGGIFTAGHTYFGMG